MAAARPQGSACRSSLARHKTSTRPQHQTNDDVLTRSIVRMDRTPVKAPYRRTRVEHMGTAFWQELSYEGSNKSRIESVPGEEKGPGGDWQEWWGGG